MGHLNRAGLMEKRRGIKMTVKKLVFCLFCLLLSASCFVCACGRKGPPVLKSDDIAPAPPQSQSVDSNNAKTPQEINTKK